MMRVLVVILQEKIPFDWKTMKRSIEMKQRKMKLGGRMETGSIDESRFALFESNGQVRVWKSPGEAYNKDCIQLTIKFEEGLMMFWDVLVGMELDLWLWWKEI